MHKGLRLVDLNNYLSIMYILKIRYCVCICLILVDLSNYLDIMYMLKVS